MEKQKVEVIPYLSFNGRCEQAVSAYIKRLRRGGAAYVPLAGGGL